ncbi:MAG: thiazole synthase, partial [Microcoleus sp. Co-bin12]|nr:thiazole synthase [Microcoleus sp. Co-bin12]
MEDHFSEFKEIVARGLQNNMPRDAKLITVGQILYAVSHDDLTIEEAWKLEEMMGGRTQWEEALEYSIFGYPVDTATPSFDKPLVIAGKTFHSRLMTGTGKYRSIAEMQQSV